MPIEPLWYLLAGITKSNKHFECVKFLTFPTSPQQQHQTKSLLKLPLRDKNLIKFVAEA